MILVKVVTSADRNFETPECDAPAPAGPIHIPVGKWTEQGFLVTPEEVVKSLPKVANLPLLLLLTVVNSVTPAFYFRCMV